MASSSTSFIQKSFKYHVFLSFRGEDTRKTFVDHLYDALKRAGIYTFRDNEELEKGNQIEELFKAIEESRYSIIVFSEKYASSRWCLKEVTKIMECQDEIEQIAYPVFYDVEPSDVRKRTGPVGKAIAKHKNNEQIEEWETALESAGNLVGWDLKNIANGHETETIKKIVEKISVKLRSIHLDNDENLIGMERRMQDLDSCLGIGVNDKARMIGIKGMGGIGKTTLARAIFDQLSSHFEGSSFVEDVREGSKTQAGLRSLQERLLSDVLNDKHMHVGSVYDGKRIMRMRLPYKKVLIVLDDVDDLKQLEVLAGDWFKDGSRIIITTRDEKVHGVSLNWIHDVSFMSDEEAVSLFSRYAFKRYIPDQGFEKLSSEVVRYAAGLPLTIKTLGSHLNGEEEDVWIDALKRLETIPPRETLEVLEISYDGLKDEDLKEIFLDVVCFMRGFPKDDAVRMLESCGFHARYGLRILEKKSLITISNDELGMHDRIEELGKNIVRRLHPREPNKHSRLWIRQEIEKLCSDNNAGIEASTCTGLSLAEVNPEVIMKGLGNLKQLRYLFLTGSCDDCFPSDWEFDEAKDYFPNSLQFLNWNGYPGYSLPQTFLAKNLVALELPDSRIVQLWESGKREPLEQLRFLHLSSCSQLRTLDLGMTPNLERLDLGWCHDLTEIHAPPGCLQKLVYLDLIGCSWSISFPFIKQLESLKLLRLPELFVNVECLDEVTRYFRNNLPMLRFAFHYYKDQQPLSTRSGLECVYLDVQPRTELESVSGSICGLYLKVLTFFGSIPELPSDIDRLKCLEELTLLSTHIICLPDGICMLKNLKFLKLKDCLYLEELPENLDWLKHLEELSLSSTSIRRLPDSICMLKKLLALKLKSCLLLQELPKDLGQLECLEKLSLLSTGIICLPDSICMLKRLRSLQVKSCLLLEEVPEDLGQLECLEELNLLSASIRRLPDSICMLKHLKALELESCGSLEKLPENIGQLQCLEILNLTECASLGDIPDSICKMKCLGYLYLSFCSQLEKLPEELGSLECLEELDIKRTRISHLPHSISLKEGLRVVGSKTVLQSCAFATQIQTSETETFCYIRVVDNTIVGTGLMNQFTQAVESTGAETGLGNQFAQAVESTGAKTGLSNQFAQAVESTGAETGSRNQFVHVVDNTGTETGVRNQFIENYCNRWCWSVALVVVALVVMQVVIQVSLKEGKAFK